MPGPMSIPNGSNPIVKIVVGYTEDGKPITRKVALQALTGQQRVQLAARGQLHTGKTDKKKDK